MKYQYEQNLCVTDQWALPEWNFSTSAEDSESKLISPPLGGPIPTRTPPSVGVYRFRNRERILKTRELVSEKSRCHSFIV
jgi:hypothetical protein